MQKIKSLAAVFLALFILAAIPTQALAAGHSIDWLVATFRTWTGEEGRQPSNPDAAFLAWVKSFVKGKRRRT